MKSLPIRLMLLFVLPLCCPRLAAQEAYPDLPMYTVITRGGDTLSGRFVGWNADTLVLINDEGRVSKILKVNIARADESTMIAVELEEEPDAAIMQFHAAPASGLIITPTAWPMPDNHPIVGVCEFAFLTAGIGLGNLITFTGASMYLNGFGEGDAYLVGMKISPLANIQRALAFGVSIIEGYDYRSDPLELYYMVYSTALGTVNASAGIAMLDDDGDQGQVLFFGTEIPLSTSFRLLLECIVPTSAYEFQLEFGAAVRIQHKRLRIELGGFLNSNENYTIRTTALPWVGIWVIL